MNFGAHEMIWEDKALLPLSKNFMIGSTKNKLLNSTGARQNALTKKNQRPSSPLKKRKNT